MKIVLALAALLHGVGLFWGLPASDGWDVDGIAPRDILPGLASTFTPGEFYTYPPVHLALLAVLTLPVTVAAVVAVVRAPGSLSVASVVREILAPSYMTAFAATARVVSLVMSLGLALAIAKLAEEIFVSDDEKEKRERGERVGLFAAAIVSAGICVTYYAHMSNLDIPALFWGSVSALMWVRAIRRREVRLIRRATLFAVLAIGSKDQAYALFVIAVPLLLGVWLFVDEWARSNRRVVLRELGISAVVGVGLLLLVDGALTNPSGFRSRVAFLRGPASQDFSGYAKGLEGSVALLFDLGRRLTMHYPAVFGVVIVGGLVMCMMHANRRTLLLRLAPLIFAVSFTVGFNMAARRTDDRFTLPQAVFVAIYAAYLMEWVWSRFTSGGLMVAARLVCGGLLAVEAWEAMRVDLTLLFEPRVRTEKFLAANVLPGGPQTIEVHGLNVYLPRFPEGAKVVRVGRVRSRNPLPGVEEAEDSLMNIGERLPKWVVISMCYAWRFREKNISAHEGRIYPEGQLREAHDTDATSFFEGMYEEKLGYRIVDDQRIPDDGYGWFRPIEIHASLNCRTTTWERR